VTEVLATPFTVARKESDPPSGTVAVEGVMATDTEDEAEDITDVEGFPHAVNGGRPSARTNTIQENHGCFRNCDFMASSL
jgi:hypothetical protein